MALSKCWWKTTWNLKEKHGIGSCTNTIFQPQIQLKLPLSRPLSLVDVIILSLQDPLDLHPCPCKIAMTRFQLPWLRKPCQIPSLVNLQLQPSLYQMKNHLVPQLKGLVKDCMWSWAPQKELTLTLLTKPKTHQASSQMGQVNSNSFCHRTTSSSIGDQCFTHLN